MTERRLPSASLAWLRRQRDAFDSAARLTQAALVLIAVQTLIRCWQTFGGNWWQDDFVFLRLARDLGLTGEYLGHIHNGHIQPIGFLLSWVGAQFPGHYWPAALFIVVMQLAGSIAIWRLLVLLVGVRPGMLVGLAVYLFTPLAVPTVTWWASTIITVPLHFCMAAAALCHLRWWRGDGRRWLLGAFGALLLGFAFSEKAVVIPVFVVLVGWMSARERPWPYVRSQLRQLPVYLLYAVPAAAYLVGYFTLVELPDNSSQSLGDFWALTQAQVLDVFPVGIIGGPWTDASPGSTLFPPSSAFVLGVAAQVFLVVALLGWWRRGARSLLVWSGLLAYLLLNVAITAVGRGRWGDLIGQDPRYLSDALPVAAVAFALLLTPIRPATVPLDRWLRRHGPVVALVVSVLVFNSGLVSASRLAPTIFRDEVSTYAANVRGAMIADPGLILYEAAVPSSLMVPAFPEEEKSQSSVLPSLGLHPRFDLPSTDLRMLDDQGAPRPILLSFPTEAKIKGKSSCGLALQSNDEKSVIFERYVPQGRQLLQVSYFTGGRGVLRITGDNSSQEVGLDEGSDTVSMVFDGGTGALDLKLRDGDGLVCITGVSTGYPVPDLEN